MADTAQPSPSLDQILLRTAAGHLGELAPMIVAADPQASVSQRSRLLCAGLAVLARSCYAALGGRAHADGVGEAAAMLSLLTKIDDQVIDALDFHGGPIGDRDRDEAELDRRTRAYLRPTLASLRQAQPVDGEARCRLAAALGRRLRALSASPERLEHLLDTVAFGWEVQVRAVRTLSRDPSRVELGEIAAVNADISGAWLLMVTMIGELPEDAGRTLGARECQAFYEWGRYIQAADALADLDKDTADGLVSSLPGVLLARAEPHRPTPRWRAAFVDGELGPLFAGMVGAGVDAAIMPTPDALAGLERELAGLGRVHEWLSWIHAFLSWRWLGHARYPGDPASSPLRSVLGEREPPLAAGWAGSLEAIAGAELERARVGTREEARPCSAP